MKKIRFALAAVGIISALALAGPVAAARPPAQYYFYDCEGDGPSSFYAVKTATPDVSGHPVSAGAALRLTDGSGTYQILSFGEGNFDPPGIRDASSSYNLVCQVNFADLGPTTVYGYFAAP